MESLLLGPDQRAQLYHTDHTNLILGTLVLFGREGGTGSGRRKP